jgi:type II secretory pathway pseudopilin PulG
MSAPDTPDLARDLSLWKAMTIVALLVSIIAAAAAGTSAYIASRQARQLAEAQSALGGAKAAQLTSDLNDQRQKTAEAEARAAEAEKKTAALNVTAGKSNERIAEVYRELFELTTPRTLTPEVRRTIADKLKQFAGTQFDVALNPDTETQTFLLQLEEVLASSGWKELDWAGTKTTLSRDNRRLAGVVDLSGVVIQMHNDQLGKLKAAADALAGALQVEGIAANSQLGLGIKNDNAAALHILVGKKPAPDVPRPN